MIRCRRGVESPRFNETPDDSAQAARFAAPDGYGAHTAYFADYRLL